MADIDVRLNLANLLARHPATADEAERLYRDVIQSGDVDGLNNLAQLLTSRNRIDEAEFVYKRAIRNQDSLARTNYALFLMEEGRFDEAEAQLRELAKEQPKEGLPRLAAFLASAGRWEEGINVLKTMVSLGVFVSPALLRLSADAPAIGKLRRGLGPPATNVFDSMKYGRAKVATRRKR